MNNPHYLTLGEAAKRTGKSKTTIHNAVKNGKVSGRKDPTTNSYQIDPAELFRVYPMVTPDVQVNSNENSQIERSVTPQNDPTLQALMDAHNETVKALRETMEEKVSNRDNEIQRWKDEVSKHQNLLNDQRSEVEKAQALADVEHQKRVDIELLPKPVIKKRRLTLKERIFGGEVAEVEEVA